MPSAPDHIDEIAGGCLAVRVRMLGRAISAIYDRALADKELTVAQMNVLVTAGKIGPCPPGEIGRILQMERSTVSRNLRPLLEHGWLEADGWHGEGERVRTVRLTERGRRKLASALPGWRRAQAEAAALLGTCGTNAVRTLGDRLWRELAPAS
jgi:DNA-binding MarR family transcriptional regulator